MTEPLKFNLTNRVAEKARVNEGNEVNEAEMGVKEVLDQGKDVKEAESKEKETKKDAVRKVVSNFMQVLTHVDDDLRKRLKAPQQFSNVFERDIAAKHTQVPLKFKKAIGSIALQSFRSNKRDSSDSSVSLTLWRQCGKEMLDLRELFENIFDSTEREQFMLTCGGAAWEFGSEIKKNKTKKGKQTKNQVKKREKDSDTEPAAVDKKHKTGVE